MRQLLTTIFAFYLACAAINASAATFDWSALGWGDGHLHEHFVVDGVDITVSITGATYRMQSNTPRISSSRLYLLSNFEHRYEDLQIRITFSEPVTINDFPITDLDRGNYHDEVALSASGGGLLPNNPRLGSNVRARSQEVYESRNNSTGPSDPEGTLTVDFDTASLTELTILYRPGRLSPRNPGNQAIYLGDFTFTKAGPTGHLEVTKTSSPSGVVADGDRIDYTIKIRNNGNSLVTGINVDDPLPQGTSYIADSTVAIGYGQSTDSGTFADNFSTGNYSGNQGTHSFSDRWHEHDNSHHHTHTSDGHDGGHIYVHNHRLRINIDEDDDDDDDNHDRGDNGDWIYRQMDLSGFSMAFLSYDYDCHGDWDDHGDNIIVMELYDGSNWTELRRYDRNCSASSENRIDISPYISSHTRIRFRVKRAHDDDAEFYVDNVLVEVDGAAVTPMSKDNAAGGHPDLVDGDPSSLVLPADGFVLDPGQEMTVTFSVMVDNPSPLLSEITNIASVTSDASNTPQTGDAHNPLAPRYDFGDAPNSYGSGVHRVQSAATSAYLAVVNGTDLPDAEATAQFSTGADGDNILDQDDENGVTFRTIASTRTVEARVRVRGQRAGTTTCGWLDVNEDGNFGLLERRCKASAGSTRLRWDGLPTDRAHNTMSRFRVSSNAASVSMAASTFSPDGEIEDHPASYDFSLLDYGDAPDVYGDPSHRVDPYLHIGQAEPDAENNSLHSANALGDDNNNEDDENGVTITSTPGLVSAAVVYTNTTGADAKLCVWLDGSQHATGIPNGNFGFAEGRCETVADGSIASTHTFTWGSGGTGNYVPVGDTYLRVRIANGTSMGFSDANTADLGSGEVEDYFLAGARDYGDANSTYGDASHGIPHVADQTTPSAATVWLGGAGDKPDAEPASQHTVSANGDDNDGNDDENGVIFRGGPGALVSADVTVNNNSGGNATVCAWLNVPTAGGTQAPNGPFTAANGECRSVTTSGQSLETFQWAVPDDQIYTTSARFRISTEAMTTSDFVGDLRDGEVEDYWISLDFDPTAVVLGRIGLTAVPVDDLLASLNHSGGREALLELLSSWDPAAARSLGNAGADAAVEDALRQHIDPDGDGLTALFQWETLEERGTIGFYVERREPGSTWERINQRLLPAMVNAPMGAEYMLLDPAAVQGVEYEYRLIEQEADGPQREYGPFRLVLE